MKLRTFVVFVVVLSSLFIIPASAKTVKVTTKEATCKPSINLDVVEAYYADLDGDGMADDVYSRVDIQLHCGNRYNFDYRISLILPSGFTVYDYLGINTRLTHFSIATTFYNYAFEAGDYQIDAEALLSTGGQFYHISSLIFDPPGGISGTGSVSSRVLY